MTDFPDDADRLEAWLREAGADEGDAPPRTDCLDDGLIAALAEGTLEPPGREEATRHLAVCAGCRRAVASVAAALDDPHVARAAAQADGPARRRLHRVAIPAAAAAIMLFALLGRREADRPPAPTHRAPAVTSAEQPTALSPVGLAARPESLRWQQVEGADLYRVTLYRADGGVLFARELRDTAAGLPDSIPLAPGTSYLWMVEARTGWNRWTASRLFEFSIASKERR